MAEVGILIIFVLLLFLILGHRRTSRLLGDRAGKELVSTNDLSRLREREDVLKSVARELGFDDTSTLSSDEFTLLIRTVQEAMVAPEAKRRLSEASDAVEVARHAAREMMRVLETGRAKGANAVVQQTRDQSFRIANQEGQISNLQNKLVAAGQGKGERPCWAQPDGTIDYLYDVVLTSKGIKMREHTNPHRDEELLALPLPDADPNETIAPETFLNRTAALFEYSKERSCRFFVVVFDATANHEKPLYKNLLRTVEGHFYKRLDNGVAPF
jgi:hypothetical protein